MSLVTLPSYSHPIKGVSTNVLYSRRLDPVGPHWGPKIEISPPCGTEVESRNLVHTILANSPVDDNDQELVPLGPAPLPRRRPSPVVCGEGGGDAGGQGEAHHDQAPMIHAGGTGGRTPSPKRITAEAVSSRTVLQKGGQKDG